MLRSRRGDPGGFGNTDGGKREGRRYKWAYEEVCGGWFEITAISAAWRGAPHKLLTEKRERNP